jgi:late competence protein required for DNA uptake (superfamily II DNA/RNA helicase)
MTYRPYRCKACGEADTLREVEVRCWTVWFRCTRCVERGDQSFNRELYQQSPAKVNAERFGG